MVTQFRRMAQKTTKKSKKKTLRRQRLVIGGIVGLLAVLSLGAGAYSYYTQLHTRNLLASRSRHIVDAVDAHPVVTIVVDTHRLPSLQGSGKTPRAKFLPVTNCFTVSAEPQYKELGKSYEHSSFAYLLTNDQSVKDSAHCTLQQLVVKYGRPNASVLIAGSYDKPLEQLVFYDKGSHLGKNVIKPISVQPAAVVPLSITDLPAPACSGPKTVLSIVAHQDDDLLFQSPDLLHDIKAGDCVRTIYLTAGDAGLNSYYWLSREHGSEVAYSSMAGASDEVWVQRIIKLTDKQFITIATPVHNPKLSLIFFHLPDGNVNGSGFSASNNQSLEKLLNGTIPAIQSVDGQSTYTTVELTAGLTTLMQHYKPAAIRTQNTHRYVSGRSNPDHSDHITTGKFAELAYARSANHASVSISYYTGYPVSNYPANVSVDDASQKELTFLNYAQYDGNVCHTVTACDATSNYHAYFYRQYQGTQ